ncbi:uncharacterized protein BN782_02262 [Eubacterium sp. CAG:786]|nr:uncharacterized protein BN782_02262 [Eubacterium sp. CAG:786]
MKIGKYPVKHSYKIPRLITDVFSVGLAIFILSVEYMFMTLYEENLRTNIGENIDKLAQADPTIVWKHWITLIFPAAVLAVFAVYLVLVLTSHRMSRLNITKRNAQKVRDLYALCVSLCKIPALMFISEMMMITHNKMLMSDEGWFSVQLVLDLVVIALLICVFRNLMIKATEPVQSAEENTMHVRAVVKEETPETPAPETKDDTERS